MLNEKLEQNKNSIELALTNFILQQYGITEQFDDEFKKILGVEITTVMPFSDYLELGYALDKFDQEVPDDEASQEGAKIINDLLQKHRNDIVNNLEEQKEENTKFKPRVQFIDKLIGLLNGIKERFNVGIFVDQAHSNLTETFNYSTVIPEDMFESVKKWLETEEIPFTLGDNNEIVVECGDRETVYHVDRYLTRTLNERNKMMDRNIYMENEEKETWAFTSDHIKPEKGPKRFLMAKGSTKEEATSRAWDISSAARSFGGGKGLAPGFKIWKVGDGNLLEVAGPSFVESAEEKAYENEVAEAKKRPQDMDAYDLAKMSKPRFDPTQQPKAGAFTKDTKAMMKRKDPHDRKTMKHKGKMFESKELKEQVMGMTPMPTIMRMRALAGIEGNSPVNEMEGMEPEITVPTQSESYMAILDHLAAIQALLPGITLSEYQEFIASIEAMTDEFEL